jgi:molybdenum cofactor synthesis domain-containing protein
VSGGRAIRAAVLTASDRCSRGAAIDTSGPAVCELLGRSLGAEIVATRCVPDDRATLATAFREWTRPEAGIDLVVSTGGTGLAPRDVTPEAALDVIERRHDGLLDLARLRCMSKTPRTFLSRGVSGCAGRTLILTLPGSPRGATEMLEALLDLLPHAIETLRGEVQDDGRPGAVAIDGKVVEHRD